MLKFINIYNLHFKILTIFRYSTFTIFHSIINFVIKEKMIINEKNLKKEEKRV